MAVGGGDGQILYFHVFYLSTATTFLPWNRLSQCLRKPYKFVCEFHALVIIAGMAGITTSVTQRTNKN